MTLELVGELSAALHADPRVRAVRERDDHVEVVLRPGLYRVPPETLRALARFDYGVQALERVGSPDHYRLEVV